MFSYETRIGILTVVSIVMLIWGYKFIKGKNILSSSTLLYVEYDDIDGLSISEPVKYRGFQIGVVGDITRNNEKDNLLVTLDVAKDEPIPKNAVANIVTTGFMGGHAIELTFPKPCTGGDCANSGDYIEGRTKRMLASMVGTPDEVGVYIDEFKNNIGDIVDTLQNKLGGEDGQASQTMNDINTILNNLKNTTSRLDAMMARSGGKIEGMLANMESITANLEASNADIKNIISNANAMTNDLKNANLGTTVTKANTAMDGATDAIASLKTTLASADGMVQKLNGLIDQVKSDDNTLGMLMNDKAIYDDLDATLKNMNFLLQDLRLHPERYRRILSKKKMPYEAPVNDPATSGN